MNLEISSIMKCKALAEAIGFFKGFKIQHLKALFVIRFVFGTSALILLMGASEYPAVRLCHVYDNRAFMEVKKPTFQKKDLIELLKTSEVKSVEKLLGLIPESFRSRAILVFKSGSLQEASPLHPRILLYNEDASFVMTFNGDASQLGFETVETMSFNASTYSFEFEEFVLPEDFEARKSYLEKKEMETELADLHDRGERNGVNARACLGCHREKPRPNWEAYPMWPGVLGQMHPNSLNPEMGKDTKDYGREEIDIVRNLLQTYETNPRYKHVTFFKKVEKCADEISQSNVLFNNLLSRINFLRLLRDLKCHPNYKTFESFEGFIRDHENLNWYSLARLGTTADEYKRFVQELRAKQLNSFLINATMIQTTLKNLNPAEQRERMGRLFPNLSESVTRFQLVLNKFMKIDLTDYEMSLVRGTYVFLNGTEGIVDFFKVKKRMADQIRCSY